VTSRPGALRIDLSSPRSWSASPPPGAAPAPPAAPRAEPEEPRTTPPPGRAPVERQPLARRPSGTGERPADDPDPTVRFPQAPPGGGESSIRIERVGVLLAGSSCGVCAQEVGDAAFLCRACESPHHPECWSYNEGCSTFGCQSTMARQSPRARPSGQLRPIAID
jgi:hypothetical protein